LLALCLLAVLWGTTAFVPLPYVTYYPGPTVDILAARDGEETVQVEGHEAYYDDGELRMTTVYVSTPQEDVTLPELLRAYFDPDAAVAALGVLKIALGWPLQLAALGTMVWLLSRNRTPVTPAGGDATPA
jgi:PDZ domain-containing secreted protein